MKTERPIEELREELSRTSNESIEIDSRGRSSFNYYPKRMEKVADRIFKMNC